MFDLPAEGAFTTLPVYRQPLWLDRHIERLNETIAALGLKRIVTAKEILTALAAEGISHQAVRIEADQAATTLVTRSLPVVPDTGYRLLPMPHPVPAPAAHWKRNDRSAYTEAKALAVEQGYHDALLLDGAGHVLETTVANIFLLKDDQLVTPPADGKLLPGIVRGFLLLQVPVEIRPINLSELKDAQAVLITNSLIGIQRVDQIGQHRFAPCSSPVLSEIQTLYAKQILSVQ